MLIVIMKLQISSLEIFLGNNELLEILYYEIIACCCVRTNKFHKAFIFSGDGANGKGFLAQIINKILGEENCSSESLKDLTNNRFSTSSLYHKTCNISSDEDFNQVVDTGLLKRLISGDRISAEFKGKDKFEFSPVATIIIIINNHIPFNDHSYGFRRRFLIIEFPNQFTKEKGNKDDNLIERLCTRENLEYIVSKALYHFANVLKTQEFTEPECVRERTEQYMLENNSVAEFIHDNPEYLEYEISSKDFVNVYNEWADKSNRPKLDGVAFGRLLKATKLGFTKGKEKKVPGKPRGNTYIGPKYDKSKEWNPNITECDLCQYKMMCTNLGATPEQLEDIKNLDL